MSDSQDRIHNSHDHFYKDFFSHPEMVWDLLRDFVKPDWLDQLDKSSWEKVNASFVTHDARSRSDDVVWKVRWAGQWIWIYLILEFQSSIDYSMPVRVCTYTGLLWQDLIKSRQVSWKGPLPPILPIVLYNGRKRWDASLDLQSMLLSGPPGMDPYRPQMRYILVDEGAYSDSELKPLHNLVAALFRMENSRTGREINEVLGALCEWLKAPEQISLRRVFAAWVGRVIMRKIPDAKIEGIDSLQEMQVMLSERLDEWAEEWRKEGREEGREEGLHDGEVKVLMRQIAKRFGMVPGWAATRLQQAELEQLEAWSERLLDVHSLEELFE